MDYIITSTITIIAIITITIITSIITITVDVHTKVGFPSGIIR